MGESIMTLRVWIETRPPSKMYAEYKGLSQADVNLAITRYSLYLPFDVYVEVTE